MGKEVTAEQLEEFELGVARLAKEFFEEEGGDLPVEWRITDRSRFERNHYFDVPYAHMASSVSELDEILRILLSNLSSASSRLDVFLRTRDHLVKGIEKENAGLADRLQTEENPLLARVEALSSEQRDVLKEILDLEERLGRCEKVSRNKSRLLEEKDSLDQGVYASHICDALGLSPADHAKAGTFGTLVNELIKKAGLSEEALKNRENRMSKYREQKAGEVNG